MSNAIANLLSDTIPTPEMEAIADYIGAMNRLAQDWAEGVHSLANNFIGPAKADTVINKRLAKLLTTVPFSAWGKIMVTKPKGLNDNMMPFILQLNTQLEALQDIHTRLYRPLNKYIQLQIAVPEERNKLWNPRELELAEIDQLTKDFKSYYAKDVGAQRGDEQALVESIYSGERDFAAVGRKMAEINKVIESIDLNAIREEEEKLHETIRLYVDCLRNGDAEAPDNKENIRRFEQAIYQAAAETELLAITLYTYKTCQTAFEEACDILEKALEA